MIGSRKKNSIINLKLFIIKIEKEHIPISERKKEATETYKLLLGVVDQFHLPFLAQLQDEGHNQEDDLHEGCYGHILNACHLSS